MPLSRSRLFLCETRFGAFDARCPTCWGAAFLILVAILAFAFVWGFLVFFFFDFISHLYITIH